MKIQSFFLGILIMATQIFTFEFNIQMPHIMFFETFFVAELPRANIAFPSVTFQF